MLIYAMEGVANSKKIESCRNSGELCRGTDKMGCFIECFVAGFEGIIFDDFGT